MPVIWITASPTLVDENNPALFTISARRPINFERAIDVQIHVAQVGSFIRWRAPRQITIEENRNEFELKIQIFNDSSPESTGGSITVTIERKDESNYLIDQNRNPAL